MPMELQDFESKDTLMLVLLVKPSGMVLFPKHDLWAFKVFVNIICMAVLVSICPLVYPHNANGKTLTHNGSRFCMQFYLHDDILY